jgi:hypothetical protein
MARHNCVFAKYNHRVINMHPSTVWSARLFKIAAIYGFIVLLPQYFMEEQLGKDYPPAFNHPEQFYGFLGVALAWQVAFWIIAHDPLRYRLFMLPAALEKITWGVATAVLFAQGRLHGFVLAAGVVDLVFAALFLWAFKACANSSQTK